MSTTGIWNSGRWDESFWGGLGLRLGTVPKTVSVIPSPARVIAGSFVATNPAAVSAITSRAGFFLQQIVPASSASVTFQSYSAHVVQNFIISGIPAKVPIQTRHAGVYNSTPKQGVTRYTVPGCFIRAEYVQC